MDVMQKDPWLYFINQADITPHHLQRRRALCISV
jgi:hypothetical protein